MLDKIDRLMLYELDKNARIPETQLAKRIGRSKESVRYRIKQLKEKGIITRFYTWIDPSKLGYHTYKIYLKLANVPEQKRAFIEHLKKEPRVFWLGVADGAWDIGLTFFAKNNLEFYRFEHQLLFTFRDLILKKFTGVLVNVMVCSKDFLVEKAESHSYTLFDDPRTDTLDGVDQKILSILFADARASIVDIARKAQTRVDVVRKKMKLLQEKKIIVGYKAAIDFSVLGYEFYKAFIFLKNLSDRDERKFVEYVKQHPHIVHMVRQISPWDVELEILVPSHAEYNKIINDVKKEFSNIIVDVESAIMSEDYVFPAERVVF